MKRFLLPSAFLAGILTFLISFAILIPSVAPSIPGGHDSGEVMSDALVLGIAHPPGYPLYTMLGHLWSYLPFGNLAYRMNLFSAFALALAGGFLAHGFARVTSFRSGIGAALLYCFAMSPWRQGVGAEVFALHLCILSALVMTAIRWTQAETLRDRRWWMFWGCFVFGLGIAHHHTIALAAFGVLPFMVSSRGQGRPWGLTWYAVAALLVVGFLPYAYLYIRARQDCPMNWSDPSTFQSLKEHILRKAYGSFSLNPASGTISRSEDAQVLAYFASIVRNQFPFPLTLLLAGGLAAAVQRPRLGFLLFGWIFFVYGAGFALLAAQPPQEFFVDMSDRFYSSSYIGAAGLIALALHWIECQWQGTRWRKLAWAFPFLFLYTVSLNWSACSQAGQYHADDHMQAILDYIPKGSVLCVDGDLPAGEYDYYQYVLKTRPDVIGIFPGLLAADWYRHKWMPKELGDAFWKRFQSSEEDKQPIQSFVEECRARGMTVYMTNWIGEMTRGNVVSEGLVVRYVSEHEPTPSRAEHLAAAKKALAFLESRTRRGNYRLDLRSQTFWTRFLIGNWVRAYRQVARDLYPDDVKGAEVLALRRALDMDPGLADDWLNLALLLQDQNRLDEAEQALDQVLKLEPGRRQALEAKLHISQMRGQTMAVPKSAAALETACRF